MSILEVWNKICSHQITGLMYHFQFADMFYFLGLDSLGKDQECHYRSESDSVRKNHCFVLKHHNKLVDARHAESVNLIPSTWARYSMGDVDKNTRKNHVASIFSSWLAWETKTKELYTEMYHKAMEQNAIADACRIKEMILDVEDELVRIRERDNYLRMYEYSVEAQMCL